MMSNLESRTAALSAAGYRLSSSRILACSVGVVKVDAGGPRGRGLGTVVAECSLQAGEL